LDLLIRTVLEKVHLLLVSGLLYWLPKERKKSIDRRMGFDNLHKKNKAIPQLFFSHDNYLKNYTGNFKTRLISMTARWSC
jgi:hypothetical protein